MVDTGADGTGRVDKSIVNALQLPVTGATINDDGINTAQIDVVTVESLSFGGLTKNSVSLLSRDYNGNRTGKDRLDGILGLEFFAVGTLEIDFPQRKLRYRSTGTLSEDDEFVFAYQDRLALPIAFETRTLPGWIDTGSNAPLHFPKSVLDWAKTTEPVQRGVGRRAYTEFPVWEATILEQLRVGAITVEKPTAGFSELVDRVNIGNTFLKDYVLTIDQPRKQIGLRPSDSPTK
jgi:hypothetical protein